MVSFREQLRRHSVALISLAVALTSLGYNTWRNEQTEANRNVRTAGIEMLLVLGELEQVAFFLTYDSESGRGNAREGWAYVLTARDLSSLTAEPAVSAVNALLKTWDADWDQLGIDQEAGDRVSAAIDEARASTLAVLANLD